MIILDFTKTSLNFIARIAKSSFNQRNLLTLPLNFLINFLPIFIWIFIFNNAGRIPVNIRPQIHSKFAFFHDAFFFGDFFGELDRQLRDRYISTRVSYFTAGLSSTLFLLVIPLCLWFYIYYVKRSTNNVLEWYDDIFHSADRRNPKRLRALILPFLIPALSHVVLNIAHSFTAQFLGNFTGTKDTIAWVSYVVFHVMAPILTAIYLYVFQPPGTVKCFALALGIQNIAGVCTHLLFPTASPWFIHMYGINDTEHVNYSQKGFAAGLIRFDRRLGSKISSDGFQLSPVVFGAVPSLHSAIAFQCFLFIVSRSTSLKHRFCTGRTMSGVQGSNSVVPTSLHLTLSEDSSDNSGSRTSSSDSETVELQGFRTSSASSKMLITSDTDTDLELGMSEIPASLSELTSSLSSSTSSSSTLRPTSTPTPLQPLSNTNTEAEFDLFELRDREQLKFLKLYEEDHEYSSRWYFRPWNTGLVPKMIVTGYLTLQWWATQYLDHHYRFDLFVGMLYSLISFSLVDYFILQPKVLQSWLLVRLGVREDEKNEARTLGMRVFEGTKLEWFFDPLA